jgi:hypothetical protein
MPPILCCPMLSMRREESKAPTRAFIRRWLLGKRRMFSGVPSSATWGTSTGCLSLLSKMPGTRSRNSSCGLELSMTAYDGQLWTGGDIQTRG